MAPRAWLVTNESGYEAIFLDRARAEQAAIQHHGVLEDLVPGSDVRRMVEAAFHAGETAARSSTEVQR